MEDIREMLKKVAAGELSVDNAVLELKKEPFTAAGYDDLGFAKLDTHRKLRQGAAEVIYGAGKTPEQIVSQGITLVPEGRRVFADLTVLENLKIGAYMRKDSLEEDINWCYDLFPRLKERNWQLAGTLSGGEQQMLAIARALMSRPDIIMMDEPSLGLAPIVVKGVFDIIREINKQGKTILLVEQNANMALRAAHHGYVMETGTITLSGTGEELASDESVKAAYLGKNKKNNAVR